VVVRIEVLRAVEEEVFAEDEGADASTESEDEPEA